MQTPREEGPTGPGSRPEGADSSSASGTYRLDALHLEHVLATLKREHEKAKISRFQRVSFTLLQIAAYAIPVALLFMWLIRKASFGETKVGGATCLLAAVLGLAVVSMLVLVNSARSVTPLNSPPSLTVRALR